MHFTWAFTFEDAALEEKSLAFSGHDVLHWFGSNNGLLNITPGESIVSFLWTAEVFVIGPKAGLSVLFSLSFTIFFNSLAGEDEEDNTTDDCRAVFAKELAVGASNLDDVEDLVGTLVEDDVDVAVPMLDVLEALTTPFFTPILPMVPEPEFEAWIPESLVPMDETATAEVRDFPDPTIIEFCRLPALRRLCLPDPEPAEELDAIIGASPNGGIGDLDREVYEDAIEPCGCV